MLELMVGLLLIVLLLLPVVSVILGLITRSRVKEQAAQIAALQRDVERLRQRLPSKEEPAAPPSPLAAPASRAAPPPPPIPAATAAAREPTPPSPEWSAIPLPTAAPAPAAPPPVPPPPPSEPEPPPQIVPPPEPPAEGFDWERFLGVKFFSWIAGVALVIAAGFFLHYSIQQGWLAPPVRLVLGLIVGTALVVACEMRVARDYAVTANALHGAGIAILLSTLWAGHARWHLLPLLVAFAGMALVAAIAVALALRRDSPFVALLGLVGGFVTPLALPGAEGNVVALFGYLLLLSIGLAWVAMRKGWSFLLVASLVLTTIYEWRWVARSLDERMLGVAVVVFLAFPLANAALLLAARRRAAEGSADLGEGAGNSRTSEAFRKVAAVSAALPAAFALFMSATPRYANHHGLVLGFLWIVVAGLAAFAVLAGVTELAALAGLVALAGWSAWLIACRDLGAAWPAAAGVLALTVATLALAPAAARRLGRPHGGLVTFAAITGALLVAVLIPFAALRDAGIAPWLILTAPILLLAAVGVAGALVGDGRPFAIATICAATCHLAWSGRHLPPHAIATVLPALALGTIVAIGLPWLVAHRRGPWRADRADALGSLFVLVLALLVTDRGLAPGPWPAWLAMLLVLGTAVGVHAVDRRRSGPLGTVLVAGMVVLAAWTSAGPLAPAGLVAAVAAIVLAGLGAGAWRAHARIESAAGRDPASRIAVAAGCVVLLAPVVVAMHAARADGPSLAPVTILTIAFVALAFAVGAQASPRLPLVAVAFATLPLLAANVRGMLEPAPARAPGAALAVAALIVHAAFLAWPMALGARVGRDLGAHVAAAVSALPAFLIARHGLVRSGHDDLLGLLAVVQAALLLGLLAHVVRWEAREPGSAVPARRALVAGAALAFLTAAIPLQLDKEWITVGLALECAALAWLFARRIPHRGLFWWCMGLAVAVVVRLAMNPAVLAYHPRAETPLFNWFLYAYGTCAVALLVAARFLSTADDSLPAPLPPARGVLRAFAGLLLFLLLNIEIADFWSEGTTLTFQFGSGLAQDLSYTLGWAAFAIGLLIVGIAGSSRAARFASIALLLVVVLKAFLHDLHRLGGLYRVGAFVGLAVSLALVAVLFQKFVLRRAAPRGGGNVT